MTATDLTEKLAQYRRAVEIFTDRLRDDRNILAAVLVGTLDEETIWRKESLHLWVIEVDGVTKRLRADGQNEDIYRILVEEGINLHVELIPRSRFKQMVEGSSRTSFSCNFFAHRELVYCDDASITSWFQSANTAATKDVEKELLATTTWAIHAQRHVQKRLEVKLDLNFCQQNLIWAAHAIAALEIVAHGEVCEHEIIYRAMELKPDLFQTIYTDVIARRPVKKTLQTALDAVRAYLDEHAEAFLKPVLHYLKKRQDVVPLSEISEHFAFTQIYPWHLESACEWLEERGLIEKHASPFKLTKKSRVDVEEPAYLLLDI